MYKKLNILSLIIVVMLIASACDTVESPIADAEDLQLAEFESSNTLLTITASDLLNPFTQSELDDNWTADRKFPTGGVQSVSFDGRDDVAAIGVLGSEQDPSGNSFYYYEGIKKVDNFGNTVTVDLYVPNEWANADSSPLNVGLWASDSPLSAYPLIVYRNGEDVDAGFYIYQYVFDENGVFVEAKYTPSGVDVEYGGWNTLTIHLDESNDSFNYIINGESAGEMDKVFGSIGDYIGQVFLNHYNNGDLDYTAYWHAGIPDPETKDDCKDDGYLNYGYDNQGRCIQDVNTDIDSR